MTIRPANLIDIDGNPLRYGCRKQITRPSDTTIYGNGDVVGVTGGGTACIEFTNMGPSAGGEIELCSSRFQRNASALIGAEAGYTLYLYNVTQPGAQVDNAVFTIAAGDMASYLGKIALGTPVDEGAILHVEVNNIGKQITLLTSSLFGVLVTDVGYQPASAAVHVVELHSKFL